MARISRRAVGGPRRPAGEDPILRRRKPAPPTRSPPGSAGRPAARAVRPARSPTGGRVSMILAGACAVAIYAPPVFMVIVAGLMPTVTALVVDRTPRFTTSRAVLAMNVAGLVLPVATLLRQGGGMPAATRILGTPHMWLSMYGAAAIGWACVLVLPVLTRLALDGRAAQVIDRLERRCEILARTWGDDVRE